MLHGRSLDPLSQPPPDPPQYVGLPWLEFYAVDKWCVEGQWSFQGLAKVELSAATTLYLYPKEDFLFQLWSHSPWSSTTMSWRFDCSVSAVSTRWWFIDLWLAQLGGKHEKCCSQWQKTSYNKKRWKERADRKKNAVRLKRPTLNAFTVRAVIVCVCVPFAMSAHWQHSPVLSLCVPWVGVT